jgi:hypothetical protein
MGPPRPPNVLADLLGGEEPEPEPDEEAATMVEKRGGRSDELGRFRIEIE